MTSLYMKIREAKNANKISKRYHSLYVSNEVIILDLYGSSIRYIFNVK